MSAQRRDVSMPKDPKRAAPYGNRTYGIALINNHRRVYVLFALFSVICVPWYRLAMLLRIIIPFPVTHVQAGATSDRRVFPVEQWEARAQLVAMSYICLPR
jgi:hypothetical protein